MDLRFYAKALRGMDIRGRFDDARDIARMTGRHTAGIAADMVKCALRYGAGPADYRLFALYDKTPAQRSTFVTRGVNNALVRKWNDPACCDRIDDKVRFHSLFSAFTGRAYLPTAQLTARTLAEFCDGKACVLYKPSREGCGRGIERITPSEWETDALLQYLKQKGDGLLEEMVVQHSALAAINPNSVNTVRLVTIRTDAGVQILFAFLRMGTGGKIVDNLNNSGIAARIHPSDGRISLPAAGKDDAVWTAHPNTNMPIVGFTVPLWDQVRRIAVQAAEVVPQVRYVGWDIAVRQSDVVLIEGNSYPGHDILQLPAYTPDGIGVKAIVAPYL